LNTIGITMGDPAGIGPEVVCKAMAEMSAEERAASLVIGDPVFMERADALVKSGLRFVAGDGPLPSGAVRLLAIEAPNREAIVPGVLSPNAGEAAYRCVKKCVELALAGEIDVVVNAPLNKAALRAAGYPYNGHAGLLAHFTGTKTSYAVLASPQLSVIHVSTHVSLAKAAEACRTDAILRTIRAGHRHVLSTGIARPRIAVAGLNPHCGEGGLFGTEDEQYVVPAVKAAREEGIDVTGPVPGDVVFIQAVDGKYDLVVAQFHDQGHIPAKLIGRHETVNISAGLPILRASVDHGTAFDIAWKGVADHHNMKAAIAMARRMKPVTDA
jgi:4-hydroxythreonine-4-phosphate dehydrogenase